MVSFLIFSTTKTLLLEQKYYYLTKFRFYIICLKRSSIQLRGSEDASAYVCPLVTWLLPQQTVMATLVDADEAHGISVPVPATRVSLEVSDTT